MVINWISIHCYIWPIDVSKRKFMSTNYTKQCTLPTFQSKRVYKQMLPKYHKETNQQKPKNFFFVSHKIYEK